MDANRPKYAYIVFRKMQAMNTCVETYNYPFLKRKLFEKKPKHKFLNELFNRLQSEDDKLNELNGCLINVENGGLPDEINWLNIKYDFYERKCRQLGIWILAVILITITAAVLIPFKGTASHSLSKISQDCDQIIYNQKQQAPSGADPNVYIKLEAWLSYKATAIN